MYPRRLSSEQISNVFLRLDSLSAGSANSLMRSTDLITSIESIEEKVLAASTIGGIYIEMHSRIAFGVLAAIKSRARWRRGAVAHSSAASVTLLDALCATRSRVLRRPGYRARRQPLRAATPPVITSTAWRRGETGQEHAGVCVRPRVTDFKRSRKSGGHAGACWSGHRT